MIEQGEALPRVISIVGPTASGKSALSELVAKRLGTSVISIDSMQVYRGMDIGTAKTPVSQRTCPLLMVDVAEVGQEYSVTQFRDEARRCADSLLAEDKVPVLCGGTGFYLNAVIDEMEFPSGERGDSRRQSYESLLAAQGADALYRLLLERDPRSAKLVHPNNSRRVIRALEMLDDGTCYADQNATLHIRRAHYDAKIFGLTMDREALYRRIDDRVDLMVDQGLVDEVRDLAGKGLRVDTTAGQAIGYKEILEYLKGSCSLDEALEQVKMRSRRYAKRQLSWFRRDGRVRWINLDETDLDEARDIVLSECDVSGGDC